MPVSAAVFWVNWDHGGCSRHVISNACQTALTLCNVNAVTCARNHVMGTPLRFHGMPPDFSPLLLATAALLKTLHVRMYRDIGGFCCHSRVTATTTCIITCLNQKDSNAATCPHDYMQQPQKHNADNGMQSTRVHMYMQLTWKLANSRAHTRVRPLRFRTLIAACTVPCTEFSSFFCAE